MRRRLALKKKCTWTDFGCGYTSCRPGNIFARIVHDHDMLQQDQKLHGNCMQCGFVDLWWLTIIKSCRSSCFGCGDLA